MIISNKKIKKRKVHQGLGVEGRGAQGIPHSGYGEGTPVCARTERSLSHVHQKAMDNVKNTRSYLYNFLKYIY